MSYIGQTEQAPEIEKFEGFTVSVPPPVEEGTYSATLTGFDAWDWDSPDGVLPRLSWKFDVVVDGTVVALSGITGRPIQGERIHVKSKAATWLAALVGAASISDGASFDLSGLVGKSCLVGVGPRKKDGEPEVQNVMAAPRQTASQPVSQPAPQPVPAPVVTPPPAVPVQAPPLPTPSSAATEFDDLPF